MSISCSISLHFSLLLFEVFLCDWLFAKRACVVSLEPVFYTCIVEVMPFVAGKSYHCVLFRVFNHTDNTGRNIVTFFLVGWLEFACCEAS